MVKPTPGVPKNPRLAQCGQQRSKTIDLKEKALPPNSGDRALWTFGNGQGKGRRDCGSAGPLADPWDGQPRVVRGLDGGTWIGSNAIVRLLRCRCHHLAGCCSIIRMGQGPISMMIPGQNEFLETKISVLVIHGPDRTLIRAWSARAFRIFIKEKTHRPNPTETDPPAKARVPSNQRTVDRTSSVLNVRPGRTWKPVRESLYPVAATPENLGATSGIAGAATAVTQLS